MAVFTKRAPFLARNYRAFALVRLANLTENEIAHEQFGKAFDAVTLGDQAGVRDAARRDLQDVDLHERRGDATGRSRRRDEGAAPVGRRASVAHRGA
jgi:hypothetical protein